MAEFDFSRDKDFLADREYYTKISKHVLLMPDGNRRYAREQSITDREVYTLARKAIDAFLQVSFDEYDIEEDSIFLFRPHSFSQQKRSYENVRQILSIMDGFCEDMLNGNLPLKNPDDIGFNVITLASEEWMKPPEAIISDPATLEQWYRNKETFEKVQQRYNKGKKRLNLLVNYSGRTELEKALEAGKDKLQITKDIGLTIRCGDSMRLSDGPLYALWHSHIYLIHKQFPLVTKDDFREVMGKYFAK